MILILKLMCDYVYDISVIKPGHTTPKIGRESHRCINEGKLQSVGGSRYLENGLFWGM